MAHENFVLFKRSGQIVPFTEDEFDKLFEMVSRNEAIISGGAPEVVVPYLEAMYRQQAHENQPAAA